MNSVFPYSIIEDVSWEIASLERVQSIPRDIRGIQPLFCAVILQAFADVAGMIPSCGGEFGIIKRRAECWLRSDMRDFHYVCSLAGVKSEIIRGAAVDIEAGRRTFLHKPKGRKPHSFGS